MRLEDWLAVGFVVALMFVFVTIGVIALTGSNKVEDTVLVRSPVDHTVMLVSKMPQRQWGFKHCTPTNADCGRLE